MWHSDPARAGLECYDHGEIADLHKQFRKTAVRGYSYGGNKKKSVLLRLSTGNPVIWNNEKHEWQDIEVVDKRLKRKFKSLVRDGGGFGKFQDTSNRDQKSDWNSEVLCYLPRRKIIEKIQPEVADVYIIRQERSNRVIHTKTETDKDLKPIYESSHTCLDRKRKSLDPAVHRDRTDEEKRVLRDLTKIGLRGYRDD
jgi:hypothetical protein